MTLEHKIKELIQKADKYYYLLKSDEEHLVKEYLQICIELASESFVAGRSKMSWKDFLESKGIKQ